MGDIADWLLASQDPYGFDGDEDDDIPFRSSHQQVHCKRCGALDVRWRQQGGKWVLFSLRPGVVHTCPVSSDDFEVVK